VARTAGLLASGATVVTYRGTRSTDSRLGRSRAAASGRSTPGRQSASRVVGASAVSPSGGWSGRSDRARIGSPLAVGEGEPIARAELTRQAAAAVAELSGTGADPA
jgi:hypothetical protein